jgi:hypothetical protein
VHQSNRVLTSAWLIVCLVLNQSGCHQSRNAANLEQAALSTFIDTYWRPDLFSGECTGLHFEPNSTLNVYAEAPGFTVGLLDVATLAPIDVQGALKEGGAGLESLAKLGAVEPGFGPIRLDDFSSARKSKWILPPETWQPADGYLLRFSNRVRFQDRIYLQLWVKGSRSSSGRRIDFQFDATGRLLQSQILINRCDDMG